MTTIQKTPIGRLLLIILMYHILNIVGFTLIMAIIGKGDSWGYGLVGSSMVNVVALPVDIFIAIVLNDFINRKTNPIFYIRNLNLIWLFIIISTFECGSAIVDASSFYRIYIVLKEGKFNFELAARTMLIVVTVISFIGSFFIFGNKKNEETPNKSATT